MNPFHSRPDDILWKFKIKDWFDVADPVACDILMLLVADEDLMNIERFKEILDSNLCGEEADEITRIKWRKVHFFLMEAIDSFRNQASFYYSEGSLRKALERENPRLEKLS